MSFIRAFFKDVEDGFMLTMMLLVMPALLSLSLLLLDISRITNAHSDLQAVADANALAGARELDRSPSAITAARAAMAQVPNTVSFLGKGGGSANQTLTYANTPSNAIKAVFLDDIPADDDTPIDTAWLAAHDVETVSGLGPEDARYVYVQVRSIDFDPFFQFMTGSLALTEAQDVPVGAIAVAKSVSAACNVVPLYICNPFEFDSSGTYQGNLLRDQFRAGNLHGRLIRMHPKGNQTASPGNFGFLQVTGINNTTNTTNASANALRQIFAGANNPTCYDSEEVTTKPGAAVSIRNGINTRFDIFEGNFSNPQTNPNNPNYIPLATALNVRKGYRRGTTGPNNACNTELSDDHLGDQDGTDDGVFGFPYDAVMTPPNQGIAGAFFGDGNWDLDLYITENYGSTHLATIRTAMNAYTSTYLNLPLNTVLQPSRYDVYRAEQEINYPGTTTKLYEWRNTSTDLSYGQEDGRPQCGASKSIPSVQSPDPVTGDASLDRRLSFAAMIDCDTNAGAGGGINDYPVNSFVSVFMTSPMEQNGSVDATIDLEIVDISGSGSGGALEDFVRDEAVLVR